MRHSTHRTLLALVCIAFPGTLMAEISGRNLCGLLVFHRLQLGSHIFLLSLQQCVAGINDLRAQQTVV